MTTNPNSAVAASNGHLSPLADSVINAEELVSDTDSDLSDIHESNNLPAKNSTNGTLRFDGNEFVDRMDMESSNQDDVDASEDGDYDLETPEQVNADGEREGRSTSQESRRPAKRKAGVEDDEHIINNPELYGLRRSVSKEVMTRRR